METGFLTESDGTPSTTRAMSFICLIATIGMGGYIVYKSVTTPLPDPATGVYIFTCLLVAAFCPKVLQKFIEVRYPKKPE